MYRDGVLQMLRNMIISDYAQLYELWLSCKGMGLNSIDDSREGITKTALVVFERNAGGNAFWEKQGFAVREDLVYRDCVLTSAVRIDT